MNTNQAHDYRCASIRQDSTASACDCYRYQSYSGHTQIIPTSPDPLASIAESLERLADIAEADFRLRGNVNNKVPIKSFISTVTIGKG